MSNKRAMKPLKKGTRASARKKEQTSFVAPSQPAIPLPPVIQRPLKAMARKQLRLAWIRCLLTLLCTIGALVLLQTTLDYLFDFSLEVRLELLIGDGVLLLGLFITYGILPLRRRLTLEQAALRAEEVFPIFRTSLISAVQLSKHPEGSPRLVQALLAQVCNRVKVVNLRRAITAPRLPRLFRTTFLIAGLIGGLFYLLAPKSLILLERMALMDLPLPTDTIVVPISGDMGIIPGENIELAAKATGVIPRTGRVEIYYEGKPTQIITINPKPATPELFTVAVQNIQQPLRYRFHLNDGRSPDFRVKLLHGPVLDAVAFRQNYPAYTGLKPTEHSAGNLTLLAGSILHVEGRSNQPLRTAYLQLEKEGKQVDMKVGQNQKTVSCDLPISVKGLEGFSIVLENTDGMKSQANTVYKVEVIPDKVPEISFPEGQAETATVVPNSQPRLRFEAHDDFKITQVYLCFQAATNTPDGGTSADSTPVTKIPIEIPEPSSVLSFDYLCKPAGKVPNWKEGVTINYWIEAVDNNDVTGPGVGRSTGPSSPSPRSVRS